MDLGRSRAKPLNLQPCNGSELFWTSTLPHHLGQARRSRESISGDFLVRTTLGAPIASRIRRIAKRMDSAQALGLGPCSVLRPSHPELAKTDLSVNAQAPLESGESELGLPDGSCWHDWTQLRPSRSTHPICMGGPVLDRVVSSDHCNEDHS